MTQINLILLLLLSRAGESGCKSAAAVNEGGRGDAAAPRAVLAPGPWNGQREDESTRLRSARMRRCTKRREDERVADPSER